MTSRRKATFGLWSLLVLLPGCAALRGADSKGVTVANLAADFAPGDTGTLTVGLAVHNREPVAALAKSFQGELWLNGRWFAAATSAAPPDAVLPPGESRVVTFTLPISFRREGRKADASFVNVALRGTVELAWEGRVERVPFRTTQRLEVENAPIFSREADDYR